MRRKVAFAYAILLIAMALGAVGLRLQGTRANSKLNYAAVSSAVNAAGCSSSFLVHSGSDVDVATVSGDGGITSVMPIARFGPDTRVLQVAFLCTPMTAVALLSDGRAAWANKVALLSLGNAQGWNIVPLDFGGTRMAAVGDELWIQSGSRNFRIDQPEKYDERNAAFLGRLKPVLGDLADKEPDLSTISLSRLFASEIHRLDLETGRFVESRPFPSFAYLSAHGRKHWDTYTGSGPFRYDRGDGSIAPLHDIEPDWISFPGRGKSIRMVGNGLYFISRGDFHHPDATAEPVDAVWEYDIRGDRWRIHKRLASAPDAVLFVDGRIIIASSESVAVFEPSADRWSIGRPWDSTEKPFSLARIGDKYAAITSTPVPVKRRTYSAYATLHILDQGLKAISTARIPVARSPRLVGPDSGFNESVTLF